jgi:hypothetical protein
LDKRHVESGLLSKGFKRDDADHHYFIYYTINGKKTPVKTKTSHGSAKYKKLGAPLLSQMSRQCHLTKQDFEDLVKCPLTREGYEKQLMQQGRI